MTPMTLCTTFKPKTHDETFHDLATKVLVCKETPLKGGPCAFSSSVICDGILLFKKKFKTLRKKVRLLAKGTLSLMSLCDDFV